VHGRVEQAARPPARLDGQRRHGDEVLTSVQDFRAVERRELRVRPESGEKRLQPLELPLRPRKRQLALGARFGVDQQLDLCAHRREGVAEDHDVFVIVSGGKVTIRTGGGAATGALAVAAASSRVSTQRSVKVRKSPDARPRDRCDHLKVRVLVVEDEDAIAEPLAEGVRREGMEVERAATGQEALAAAEPDLVLLDLRLPDVDGLEVCRRLRERSRVSIIVVSARGEEVDRVVGLELGADDYVVKPYRLRELVARIRAVIRRLDAPLADGSLRVGDLEIDTRARRATLGGSELRLTQREFDLVALLASDPRVRSGDIGDTAYRRHR
jgi:two-component system response regulator RegX3